VITAERKEKSAMPEIIECPQCHRKLRMDDAVLGQTVQCPSCVHTFIAELPNRSVPLPRPVDEPPIYRPIDDDPPRRRSDEVSPRRRYAEDDEDYPRPPRSRFDHYPKSHRGSSILTLGILSLCMFFCMPGFILAIVTLVMALNDLAAMRRGQMDETGRGQTKAGLICAIIALVFEGLAIFSCIGNAIIQG
jgi:hypothetical protein